LNAKEIKNKGQYPPGIEAANPPRTRNSDPAARYIPPLDLAEPATLSELLDED
jgi:hypothetical protein